MENAASASRTENKQNPYVNDNDNYNDNNNNNDMVLL